MPKGSTKMEQCQYCRRYGIIEKHHIIKRSQAKNLINFKLNIISLCSNCHRKVHSKDGREVDLRLKLRYFNEINKLLTKDKYDLPLLIDLLGISEKECLSLVKTITKGGVIEREDLIRQLMGGKYYEFISFNR